MRKKVKAKRTIKTAKKTRRKKNPNLVKKIASFTIRPKLLETLKKQARRDGVSFSNHVARIISKHLEA